MRIASAGKLVLLCLTSAAAGCCPITSRVAAGAATSIPLPSGVGKPVTATIDKGRAKSILVVEATMQEIGIYPPGDTMTMYPDVNGLGLQPDTSSPGAAKVYKNCYDPYLQPDGTGDYPVCEFSAIWWLDLDTAEAANPGTLIGKPLIVTLNTETGGNIANVNISLVAHLTHK